MYFNRFFIRTSLRFFSAFNWIIWDWSGRKTSQTTHQIRKIICWGPIIIYVKYFCNFSNLSLHLKLKILGSSNYFRINFILVRRNPTMTGFYFYLLLLSAKLLFHWENSRNACSLNSIYIFVFKYFLNHWSLHHGQCVSTAKTIK